MRRKRTLELEYRLKEVMRSDSAFLRSVGIVPCVVDGSLLELLLLPCPGGPHVPLTEKDAMWLRACGVAWEPRPEVQPRLDFCGHREAVRETETIAEAHMKKEQSRACPFDGQPLFELGQIVATPGALSALGRASQAPAEFLARHATGDWGELEAQDLAENGYSLAHGFRLLSSCRTRLGETVWVITEADRSDPAFARGILSPAGGAAMSSNANRHRDAVMIQAGACNPSGIAHAIIDACREARDQALDPCKDSAVRLMAHQLGFICRVGEMENLDTYLSLMDECREKAGIGGRDGQGG